MTLDHRDGEGEISGSDLCDCRDTRNVLLCVSTPQDSSLKKFRRSNSYFADRILTGLIYLPLRSYKTWRRSLQSPRSFILRILSWQCLVSSLWRRGTFIRLRIELSFNTKSILNSFLLHIWSLHSLPRLTVKIISIMFRS